MAQPAKRKATKGPWCLATKFDKCIHMCGEPLGHVSEHKCGLITTCKYKWVDKPAPMNTTH